VTRTSRLRFFSCLLIGGCASLTLLARPATADIVSREQDIANLRLGQRVQVDDGTCPAGQIKEVLGSRMTASGVVATKKCIQRLGPKKK